jgi:cytochrome c-type biogenesis protein CcmF
MTFVWLGRLALVLAGLSSVYTVAGGLWAYKTGNRRLQESVRGAALAVALALTAAVVALEYLLVTGDFSVWAVFYHTNRGLPLAYRAAALWGGDSGSVLFWGWIESLYMAYAAGVGWRDERRLTPVAVPILGAIMVFFTGLSNVVVNPFRIVPGQPVNGSGLDPLLQNPVMIIHPPAMYTGLIGMSVPFAMFMAALWQRVPPRTWVPVVRRWLLWAWMFLGAAIVLGGWWSYMELGWGGYWKWDPVENASLVPWLVATGALHVVQAEERRGLYKLWTGILLVATYVLTLMATYITRSGVIPDSVHSFTGTGVGPYFFGLFWVGVVLSGAVMVARRSELADQATLQRMLSREGLYYLMSFFFAVLTGVVLFGTFYPIITKTLVGTDIILQVGFFNTMTEPVFLALVALMVLAPVATWHVIKTKTMLARLKWPWWVAVAGGVAAYLWGARAPLLFIGDFLAVFAMAATVQEFVFMVRMRRRATGEDAVTALYRGVVANRRRYGGFIAHVAFLIIVLGVIGSHTGNYSVTRTFAVGQTETVGPYRVTYTGLEAVNHSSYETNEAVLLVNGDGFHNRPFTPGISFFSGSSEPVAQVFIVGNLWRDLYTVLGAYTAGGQKATVQFFVNPLVSWIWIGMFILVFGTLVAQGGPSHPRRQSASVPAMAGLLERRDQA